MLYLDYAKPLADGKYILNFFAESIEDLDSISHGQRFITKNGTDYGVPQASSTVVITMPDKTKKTYVLDESGEWQEGGVDMDYSKLENAPIILANLAEEGFVPEANTYYEHLGETTEDFIKGIIYLYDGKEYKAIDGSGSGAGVQSDYNQNDSAAADYIKNRPFYEETKTGLAEAFNETLAFKWNTEANAGSSVSKFVGASMKGVAVGESVIVIFNGVEYNLTTQELPDEFKGEIEAVGGAGFLAGAAWPTSASWTPPENLPFSLVCMWSSVDGQESTEVFGVTTINQASIPVIIKTKATVTEIHTIDPKYIKDMYYSTESLVPFINFEVISGDINTIGSTMVVKYDGKEYTETVKDATVQGSSTHKTYIGFGLGGETPTEEHPFCYGVNLLFENNIKQLFCAAPKTFSENEAVVYNGENKTVKKMTEDGFPLLYVGNVHLISADFEDTGEQYLTLFDYLKTITQGALDLVLSIVPQECVSCEVKGENISYINPKYIKDMYHETTTETELFNGTVNMEKDSGTIDTVFDLGGDGDTIDIKLDNDRYVVPVYSLGDIKAAGILENDGIQIVQYPSRMEIYTSKEYNGSTTLVCNKIHTDVTKIPSKYIPEVGYTLNIKISDTSDEAISTAIKDYLTANAEAFEQIKKVNSFDLVIDKEGLTNKYRFVDNVNMTFIRTFERQFVCLYYSNAGFNAHSYLYEDTLQIVYRDVIQEVVYKSEMAVYDNNIKFGVSPLKDIYDTPYAYGGKLGFYTLDSESGDYYKPQSDLLSLSEWITLAQQRDDFAIPTPTKDTDLVDKKFVSNAISTVVTNAITTALNTEV